MIHLVVVRHGETDSNKRGTFLGWTDVELNELGVSQANEAKEKLKNTKFDAIYSSPLKRAARTSEILNENLKVDIKYVEDLMERNFGIWDDITFKEICAKYPDEYYKWISDVTYCIPQGESAFNAFGRVTRFIDKLVNENNDGTFLIVSHLGCIRYIISHLLGLGIEGSWRFRVSNCGISNIEINDEKYAYLTKLNG